MVLNLSYCIIIPWFLYYAYRQNKVKRAAAGQICVYDPAKLIPNKPLLLVSLLYAGTVTVLWLLFMFGISNLIIDHWFSYVYLLVLPAIMNHDRVLMFIGPYGASVGGKLIPWNHITHYELKESSAVTNRWVLELQTPEKTIRGLVPADSQLDIKYALEEYAV